MKILFTTLNSKYIHSSLAVRYIEKYSKKYLPCIENEDCQIAVREFSINEPLEQITAEIYREGADIVAFSCYIWNRGLTFEVIDRLKKVEPGIIVIAGGPEVTYDAEEILIGNQDIDIIVRGEGELTFKDLIAVLLKDRDPYYNNLHSIPGIVFRNLDGGIIENPARGLIERLDTIPRPYSAEDLTRLKHKIIYYEASRGCPYNCSYCLSSTIRGVRSFSLERVKEDMLFFIENDVDQIKFVDRTFNYDKKRTLEIFKFLLEKKKNTSFHFEITADLLDEEIIEFLSSVPDGLFQFEIGVQTTNEETLSLIGRRVNFDLLAENVRSLRKYDNINLHLDLIAGLPGEDYSSFQRSFNMVYDLNPHVLQLGFLKLLKGSQVRKASDRYDYKYTQTPPYEVLENEDINYQQLMRLKDIEDVLDKFHNSGVFTNTLNFLFKNYFKSYFEFFDKLGAYFVSMNLHRRSHSRKSLYKILFDFITRDVKLSEKDEKFFSEILKYDYLLYNKGARLPEWSEEIKIEGFNELRYSFLEDKDNIERFIPDFKGERIKDILKHLSFETFRFDVVELSGKSKDPDIAIKNHDAASKDTAAPGIENKIEYENGSINKEGVDYRERIEVILFDYSNSSKPQAYNVTEFFPSFK